jgi:PAS domain S-box-containing protein
MKEAVAAQALRESEELHRITLLNMSDAVFITDEEGAFTFICPNVDVIFGYGSDEVRVMGRIATLLGCELVDRGRLATDGEIRNIEHEIATKSGERRALLVHIKRVAIKGGTTLYVCRDITERKRAEQSIRRNEERLALALEAASMGMWDWHLPTGRMNWSPETHEMFGDKETKHAPSFESFLARIDPADCPRVRMTMSDAIERGASYETEFKIHGYDDVERWILGKGKAVRNGKPLRMIGVFVDLTERHQIDEELRVLSGRLINAHEQERIRLSGELHDDAGQMVALLSAEVAVLSQLLGEARPEIARQVARISGHVEDLGSELHRLAHKLRPMALSQLGLPGSIRSLCQDFAGSRLFVDLDIAASLPQLDEDVSLGLYRITQEALQNVMKHSGARRATVALVAQAGQVSLCIADDGVGFDPAAVRLKNTLGLASMRERARLLHGQLTLTSDVGRGARVDVVVPIDASLPA